MMNALFFLKRLDGSTEIGQGASEHNDENERSTAKDTPWFLRIQDSWIPKKAHFVSALLFALLAGFFVDLTRGGVDTKIQNG